MTKNEYLIKIKAIKAQATDDIWELDKKYAIAHNIVETGDIVSDGRTIVKVTHRKIRTYQDDVPVFFYYGEECTKKGVPRKVPRTSGISQRNIETVNGKRIDA